MDPETFAAQFNVSRETLTRLLAYQALLGRGQQRINLVGPATLEIGKRFAMIVADNAVVELEVDGAPEATFAPAILKRL